MTKSEIVFTNIVLIIMCISIYYMMKDIKEDLKDIEKLRQDNENFFKQK